LERELEKANKKYLELRKIIEEYLDENVKAPAFDTIEKDFQAQDRIANILLLLQTTVDCIKKQGLDFDKSYLKQLSKPEIDKRIYVLEEFIRTNYLSQEVKENLKSDSSRKYLLVYLSRELNWVAISVLSASYISAYILMRSIFELLVGIATIKTGSMRKRINDISFFSEEERKQIYRIWQDLSGWAHPYHKWIKEVCPIFISHKTMYHPKLCIQSLKKLEKIIDILLVIALEKFEIDKQNVLNKVTTYRIDTSNFPFFHSRYAENPNIH